MKSILIPFILFSLVIHLQTPVKKADKAKETESGQIRSDTPTVEADTAEVQGKYSIVEDSLKHDVSDSSASSVPEN